MADSLRGRKKETTLGNDVGPKPTTTGKNIDKKWEAFHLPYLLKMDHQYKILQWSVTNCA